MKSPTLPKPLMFSSEIVENQKVDYLIDYLSATLTIIKFLSIELLTGPLIDLNFVDIPRVIIGGESEHEARPIGK